MNINDTLRAGGVDRWHQNPDLPGEPLASHQWRVAMLARWLCPEISLDGVMYALTHDVGELKVGDLSAETKAKDDDWLRLHASAEFYALHEMVGAFLISQAEYKIIQLADRLDAYWYMLEHNRGLRHLPEWRASYNRIMAMEDGWKIEADVYGLVSLWHERADAMDGRGHDLPIY